MQGRSYTQPSRLQRLLALAQRPGTLHEGAEARRAIERIRSQLIEDLLRKVAETPRQDLGAATYDAATVIRDARHAGKIDFADVEPALAALGETARQAGLGGFETQRALHQAMKNQRRDAP